MNIIPTKVENNSYKTALRCYHVLLLSVGLTNEYDTRKCNWRQIRLSTLHYVVNSTDQISLLNRNAGAALPNLENYFSINFNNSNFIAAKECPPPVIITQPPPAFYEPNQHPPSRQLAPSESLPTHLVVDSKKSVSQNGISVDERILSLTGIYQVLSHCYVAPIFIHRKRYRSVEHYVCQKFFKSLGFNAKAMEKLLTTTDPRKLPSIVAKILSTQFPPIPENILLEKQNRMTEWYEMALATKFDAYPILRRILLATGQAILIETNNLDDKIMSIGVSEAELQHLMTKCDVNPDKLLQYMLEPKDFYRFRNVGLNRTGVMLMKLRVQLKQTASNEASASSLFDRLPTVSSLDYDTDNITCFTCCSVLHPKYLSPIWNDNSHVVYPSVDHYVYSEGAKFLCFPQNAIQRILDCSPDDVRYVFYDEIWNRFPDPSKLFDWWSIYYDDALKNGCRTKFEKYPELMRLLLETTDSLLFYCHRFMTLNCDWSTGMRESELREWKTHNRLTNANIIDMMLDSSAKRPPFLGGNRLGFILMELRREFRLKGYQSHMLPVLTDSTNKEVLLGEAIGLETGDEFDCNTTPSKYLLWPSPMVVQLKERNVAVWYPGKRHLAGYYDEGYSPELKRPTDLRDVLIHPEYSLPVPFGKTYSVSPDIVNVTNKTDALKSMIGLLIQGIVQLNVDVNQQNERLWLMLSDIYERNSLEFDGNGNVENKSQVEDLNKSTTNATASTLIPSAVTGSFHLSPKHPMLLAKIRSLEDGFLNWMLSPGDVDQKANKDECGLNFALWDDKKISFVIQQLYSHLNATERVNALEWFKLTINKLRAVSTPSMMLYSDNSLRTFVPLTKRKANFTVPHFYKSEDSSF